MSAVRGRSLRAAAPPGHERAHETHLELELERNRVVVELAGAVAHKLKQPLAVAWGYLELMLDDPQLDLTPSTERYLREVQTALHSMDEIINKLQQATTHRTRPYPGDQQILDLD